MERYSLYKVIGEGSFGRALLVLCKTSKENYVIKEIQLPKNQSKLKNSRSEATLLSRMRHANIVAFREAFEVDDLLCIVMEYCRGGDLLQRIHQQKTEHFCVDDIIRWFAQMCAATQHIHNKWVLHRDLKSKNIFLTDNGTIKVGDFGSACILKSSKSYAQAYVGTPYYVAPEIWDNKPYSNKSDVWSLGCVLYELCTLRHPFQAPSWKSLIFKVCRGTYPPLPNHLPYELHYLIKQMFKTNPKDRPSLNTILTSHRVSRLLRTHLPSQAIEREEQGRRRWNREEGIKVAHLLGDKSLLKASTFEGHCESQEPGPRKKWATEPSDPVIQMLADASLISSSSTATTSQTLIGVSEEPEEDRKRRRWDKGPPERLLSMLEKAPLSRAFSTFLIKRGGDDTDGPELASVVDEDRLQPRSDDEDTDFEEDFPHDWMDEVEQMVWGH
ncbi:serine/threonine-protein kinase Nek3 isoform X1 [Antennarius striatus]|uniref:serine/threonine-protein kinase Nek3 isoform X1 n=1 Tax=Antennarius striatus TaxID=241820 RepID=UPI0035AF5E9B